jgi:hypothetical protein
MTDTQLRKIPLHGSALGQYVFDQIRKELQRGISPDEIRGTLVIYYDWLGDMGREDDQDAIADVMDSLVGHCPPTANLLA